MEDLEKTASSIISVAEKNTNISFLEIQQMKLNIPNFARAYNTIYHEQVIPDFFGLRDFYSLIKQLQRGLQFEKFSGETS